MKAAVYMQEDGLWHVHCPQCLTVMDPWCHGKYTDREAALSNAAAHMRGEHKPIAVEDW